MNNVPASEEISYEVEPRTDKLLDSKGEVNGGGDPDRTGDPRLMSPLLCQLSYTATPKKLTSYNVGVKEDCCTVPVFVPISVRALVRLDFLG